MEKGKLVLFFIEKKNQKLTMLRCKQQGAGRNVDLALAECSKHEQNQNLIDKEQI